MPKILGIDYGSKRIGLAITDQRQEIVFPYLTLENNKFAIDELKKICVKEDIKKIIIGLPLGLNSSETEKTKEAKNFINLLKRNSGVEVISFDERLTTRMAERFLKDYKDETSAMIILQDYLLKLGNN